MLVKQWLYLNSLKPAAELDGASNLMSQFVYGSSACAPDYVRRGTAVYRLISDNRHSPRRALNVTNASDTPLSVSYSAFGKGIGNGMDWAPFGFAGGIHDTDTGLVRFGGRDYDPSIGRWITKDPSRHQGGVNLFVYASNDPVNLLDPSGRGDQGFWGGRCCQL